MNFVQWHCLNMKEEIELEKKQLNKRFLFMPDRIKNRDNYNKVDLAKKAEDLNKFQGIESAE